MVADLRWRNGRDEAAGAARKPLPRETTDKEAEGTWPLRMGAPTTCWDVLMGGVTGPAISLLLAELLARPKLMSGRSSSDEVEYVAMSWTRSARVQSVARRTESRTPIVGVSRP